MSTTPTPATGPTAPAPSPVEGQDAASGFDPGQLQLRFGVWGDSADGSGVVGSSGQPGSATAPGGAGVLGYNAGTQGIGVKGTADGTGGTGVLGTSAQGTGVTGTGVAGPGVTGTSTQGAGVAGTGAAGPGVTGTSTQSTGVAGSSGTGSGVTGTSTQGNGVVGSAGQGSGVLGTSSTGPGVTGTSAQGTGVAGTGVAGPGVTGTSTQGAGVAGSSTHGAGISGTSLDGTGVYAGSHTGNAVTGTTTDGHGVFGNSSTGNGVTGSSANGTGVEGTSSTGSGVTGVSTQFDGMSARGGRFGVVGTGPNAGLAAFNSANSNAAYLASQCCAAWFTGPVTVTGPLTKSGGGFRIDHPLDPENRYLTHSFVESSERKNVYDGTVTLDATGGATVRLPDWFAALNENVQYQLTPVGGPAPNLHVSRPVAGDSFGIAGGPPGGQVCWQLTGVRIDPWAQHHPLATEETKPPGERGYFLHPEEHGRPIAQGLAALLRQGVPPDPPDGTQER
ncbi:hypothetical protein [Kitasatospora sp. LaBMicrA B282]|uniref:hypothetical protein n=1 Tax=Kitasatospora sp. LaBMicrA B282 TaxID=3420949 RepID=UPI003D09CB94